MLAARGGTVARDLARWQARPAAKPRQDAALSRAQHGEQDPAGTSATPRVSQRGTDTLSAARQGDVTA